MIRLAKRIPNPFSAVILTGGCLCAQTIAISPGYVNIPLGGTQQYTAAVTGLSPATVTWGVTAGGGTITQAGLYMAPSKLPSTSVLISATSKANPGISAMVYVNPEGPGPTITAMSPNPLPAGNTTITITASASAPFLKGASAVCNGAGLTANFVSATSVTVGDWVSAGTPTVTCYVSNPGTWRSNSLTVAMAGATGAGGPPPVVAPATATVGLGGLQQFSAGNVTTWTALYGGNHILGTLYGSCVHAGFCHGHDHGQGAGWQRHGNRHSASETDGIARGRDSHPRFHATVFGQQRDHMERGRRFDHFGRSLHRSHDNDRVRYGYRHGYRAGWIR